MSVTTGITFIVETDETHNERNKRNADLWWVGHSQDQKIGGALKLVTVAPPDNGDRTVGSKR